jgi:uncharacterized membrane protein
MEQARRTADGSLEGTIAGLLTAGTYASVVLLLTGTLLLLAEGRSPLDLGPTFDPASIPADVLGLRSAGFLWLGILGLILTPSARVVAALVGYARLGDRRMVTVAALILVVLVAGVVAGLAGG